MTEHTQDTSIIKAGLQIWQRRKWWLTASFLAVFILGIALILALPSLYRSSTTLLFGQEAIAEALVTNGSPEELAQRLEVVRQEVLSRRQLEEVIEKFNLYPDLRRERSLGTVIDRMRDDVSIEQESSGSPNNREGGNVTVIITYQNWNPQLVAEVTRELAERFKQENAELRMNRAMRTTEFLANELAEVRQKMTEQEIRINEFKSENLGGLPEQQAVNLATLERYNAELRLNGQKQVQLLTRLADMLSLRDQGQADAGAVMGASVEQLRTQLADMRTRYTDNFPGIIRLEKRLEELEANPPEENAGEEELFANTFGPIGDDPASIEKELGRLRQEEQRLHGRIDALQERIEYTPKVDQELSKLTSEYNTIREEFLSLQDRYQTARLSESLQRQQDREYLVLEEALPADNSSAPARMRLIAMALVMAVGFAGGVSLLRDQFDPSFHSVGDLRSFTRLPVLASIPTVPTAGDKWRNAIRFLLGSVIFLASLGILALIVYQLGQDGQGLVWMIAGPAD